MTKNDIDYSRQSVEKAIQEVQEEYDATIFEFKEKLSPEDFMNLLILEAIKKIDFCVTDLKRDILLTDSEEELDRINSHLDSLVNQIVRERYEKQS